MNNRRKLIVALGASTFAAPFGAVPGGLILKATTVLHHG
jgi:hypothetical protein